MWWEFLFIKTPYFSLRKYLKVENCLEYTKFYYQKCIKCENGVFLFETPNEILKKKFCINNLYKIENCINYNSINLTVICIECKSDYLLVHEIGNKKKCLLKTDKIDNCFLYNKNSDCEEYNRECKFKNSQECPICKLCFILVNENCEGICSEEALNCSVCQNICPIYFCLKLIPFCLECDKNNFLKWCKKDFILENGICVFKEFDFEDESELCQPNCLQCFKEICIKCEFNYYYDKNLEICVKNISVVSKHFDKDICDGLLCIENGKSQFKNCKKCKINCKCEIIHEFIDELIYLTCQDNLVTFSSKKIGKFQEYYHFPIFLDKSLKKIYFEFKENNEEHIFRIPKFLISQSKNCFFDSKKFYKIKNKKYFSDSKKSSISNFILNLFNSKTGIFPIISNFAPNSFIAYLLIFFQAQEIMNYLYLINFNGGSLFEYNI